MKIGICALGPNLDSQISPAFGRAPHFLILDSETGDFEAISNPAFQVGRGAGVGASQALVSRGVKVMICGNFGPNAFSVLKMAGIKIYPGVFGLTVREAINKYKKGELKEAKIPTVPGHFGFPQGPGRFRRRFGRRG